MPDDEVFIVASGYGHNTREPFVEIHVREERVQLVAEKAAEIGRNMIEAAEAAMSDAFLVEYVIAELGGSMENAAGLLGEFRIWRAKRRDDMEAPDA